MKLNQNNGKQISVDYLEGKETATAQEPGPEAHSDAEKKKTGKAKKAGEAYKEKYEEYHKKYEELHDQFLRLRAEFVNYRKRVEREKIEFSDYLKTEMIKRLLPVLDDFDHMLAKSEEGSNDQAVLEGAKMIYNKLYQTLKTEGLEKIEALGKEFDPQIHEAMMLQNTTEKKNHNKVLSVFQEGYMLRDRLVRPSKTVVGNYVEPEEENWFDPGEKSNQL